MSSDNTLETPLELEAMENKTQTYYKWSTIFHIIGISWGTTAPGYGASIIGITIGQPSFLYYMGLDSASNASELIGTMNSLFYIRGLSVHLQQGILQLFTDLCVII